MDFYETENRRARISLIGFEGTILDFVFGEASGYYSGFHPCFLLQLKRCTGLKIVMNKIKSQSGLEERKNEDDQR